MNARVERWNELPPSGGSVFYYPGASVSGGAHADGLLLRIERNDNTYWYAMCRGGWGDAEGLFEFSRDSSKFIVIHAGSGYCITYDDPARWEKLPMHGQVRHVIYSSDTDILMLFDWISGVGYGPQGEVWASPRLFLDGLDVVSWDADHIVLKGHDLGDEEVTTVLNVRDGSFVSGKPSRFN
jgi:hypothetical protein